MLLEKRHRETAPADLETPKGPDRVRVRDVGLGSVDLGRRATTLKFTKTKRQDVACLPVPHIGQAVPEGDGGQEKGARYVL